MVPERGLMLARMIGHITYLSDDVLHAINWVFLVAAFHAFRFRNVTHKREAILLGYGFGIEERDHPLIQRHFAGVRRGPGRVPRRGRDTKP